MSQTFRFQLERVRVLRERGEDLAKQELAGALSRRASCAERLRETRAVLAGARAAQRSVASAPTSALDLVASQAYVERVERLREASEAELQRHEADVAACLDALRAAARERQALERLKERRRADHARAAARAEGAVLDEIALVRHRRRSA